VDTFVDFDHRLAVAVSKLKDALRDSAEKPIFIETVGRRGYRIVGQLESTDSLSVNSKVETDDTPPPSTQPAARELPKLTPPGQTRSRTTSLIFLSSIALVILLGVIALPKFVHTRSGKEQSLSPRSLVILPLHNSGQDSSSDFLGFSLAGVLNEGCRQELC